MFASIFEVTFSIKNPAGTFVEDSDDDDDNFEDGSTLTTIIVCNEKMSLPEFTMALNNAKPQVLLNLGYTNSDMETAIVKVEDVFDSNSITMLPIPTSH